MNLDIICLFVGEFTISTVAGYLNYRLKLLVKLQHCIN